MKRRPRTDHFDRFRAKIDFNGPDGCWVWTAGNNNGYGAFTINRKSLRAHRVAYELLVGPIPAGLTIDHLCRNRSCVNPAHLEPVTMRENLLRGTSFAAVNARKTHCVNGHEFTPENTIAQTGGRACRTCSRASETAYRRRNGVKPWHEARHGTISRYSSYKHRCRCDLCVAAGSAYHREKYRKRKLGLAA